ncbi:MAG: tyrosine-type recombinase/integrase [Bacteroidota bacterium]
MRESFLKYLQFEKRYSKHTIISYETDLLQFEAHLTNFSQEAEISNITYRDIRSWIADLVEDKLSPNSINRKIASLRSYYKFLMKQGLIDKDPTEKIQALKTSKRLPSFISEDNIVDLLDNCEFPNDFTGQRDRLIFELLYGTGIRLSELINLKVSDINFIQRNIKVLGKRNKERIIPFPGSLENTIYQYLNLSSAFRSADTNYLLIKDDGNQCYPMIIYRTIRKYLPIFTTIEKRSPHVLRHTFATHLLNKGAELNAVKDLLGHSSLAATQVYTHNSLDKLKKVFDQAHPKA